MEMTSDLTPRLQRTAAVICMTIPDSIMRPQIASVSAEETEPLMDPPVVTVAKEEVTSKAL